MKNNQLVAQLGNILFSWRPALLVLFALITVVLSVSATRLKMDAGFQKSIPLQHEYMKTFTEYQKTFGGTNKIILVLRQKNEGDIYNADFLNTLRKLTDDVFFLPGVERPSVTSLFTPNVRFIEVVEEGFSGGNVIPAGFTGTAEELEKVRINVLKSDRVGRIVSNDFKSAMVNAELQEVDPNTGEKLDYAMVADKLEEIRAKYLNEQYDVHIIGFAKAVGDVHEGVKGVLLFFLLAFLITCVLLYWYSGSLKLSLLALVCAMIPVIWLLGLLPILGYGIDPMSILVPFLIFSIGVSHAVQMTNAWKLEVLQGADGLTAAHSAFLKLFVPGAMALLANALGFMVILHIKIAMVQELAITASLGVALMIITNKMLLTILLSYTRFAPQQDLTNTSKSLSSADEPGLKAPVYDKNHSPEATPSIMVIETKGEWLWQHIKSLTEPKRAVNVLVIAAVLLGAAAYQARNMRIGDLGKGTPEFHDDSRYNIDTATIVNSFSIGVDVLSVIVKTQGVDGACTDYDIMSSIDRFERHLKNMHGVQSTLSLAGMAKNINGGWNEGNPRWQVLSRNSSVLAQSVTPVDTSSRLLNTDCNLMQVFVFTRDHQGTTIAHIINEIKLYLAANKTPNVEFLLASGNVGVMAATNEAVEDAEVSMLLLLFASISLLCLFEFRSIRATLCIIVPLAIAAVCSNALMAWLEIGLKVSTLPVVALGVGVGVDYGIYLFERIQRGLNDGQTLTESFYQALCQRGTAILFTAVTMSIGVGAWAFSALKFQADMGLLLAFMFLVNMLGALLLLPALAAVLLKPQTLKKINNRA